MAGWDGWKDIWDGIIWGEVWSWRVRENIIFWTKLQWFWFKPLHTTFIQIGLKCNQRRGNIYTFIEVSF